MSTENKICVWDVNLVSKTKKTRYRCLKPAFFSDTWLWKEVRLNRSLREIGSNLLIRFLLVSLSTTYYFSFANYGLIYYKTDRKLHFQLPFYLHVTTLCMCIVCYFRPDQPLPQKLHFQLNDETKNAKLQILKLACWLRPWFYTVCNRDLLQGGFKLQVLMWAILLTSGFILINCVTLGPLNCSL